ncbi:hypothetical protein PFISCL1PPCAC_25838, partial [Pristionchus fissidentatus]
ISYVIHYLETNGIEVLRQRYFLPGDTAEAISAQLNETRTRGRIFLPLGGPDIAMYEQFMRAVQMADLPSYDYAVVLVLNSYNVNGLSMPWKANPELLRYYSNAIIIYNDCYNSEAARNFASKIGVSTDNADQLALYMTLYETIFFYNNLIEAQKFVLDSRGLLNFVRNQLFIGPFANYTLNEVTNRITPFRVIKSKSGDPMDLASIALHTSQCPADANKQCVQLVAHLLDTGNTTIELPLDMPVCGFEGELCEQTSTVLVIIGIVAGLALLSILFFIYRRVKGNEIRDMPWSLPVSHVQFIETNKNGETTRNQDNSFQSLQLLQELGPPPGTATGNRDDVQKRSAERGRPRLIPLPPKTRLATITNNFACVYTYPFIEKRSNFNRDEIQLFYQIKLCVHDNVNAFLGISYDSPEFLVAWQMCFKGTLTDVLMTATTEQTQVEAKKMTNNIRGAFVRDMLKGLEFLHSSQINYHGALTPNNCLVDSHWILKLSGFGMPRLLNRWRHKRTISTVDKTMFIPNSELHYYAPEVRSFWKELHASGRTEMGYIDDAIGKRADVFSFGMVLYEILYKKKFVSIPDEIGVPADDEFNVGDSPNYMFHFDAEAKIPETIDVPEDEDVHQDLRANMKKCWYRDPKTRPELIMMRRITDSTLKVSGSLVDQMMKNLENYTNDLENLVKERTAQLEIEQASAENLLLELLPKTVANELKMGRQMEPKTYKHSTILYSDIVGFTSLSSESTPMEVVKLLSGIFQAFDNIITRHDTYKVETIGDAYMVASGVPDPSKNHVRNIAQVALKNREFLEGYEIPHRPGQHLHCRWGFNSGPVYTGVVGFNAPRYCIFGHTVSLAAKMESSGIPDKIQMTVKSHQLLTARFPEFKCSPRGQVKVEGLGTFLTYWLDGVEELLVSDRSSYKRTIDESERGSMERETSTVPDRPPID